MSVDPFGSRGRVVLVTGGTAGIGRIIAMGFAAAGARVYVVGRDRHRAETAAEEIRDACGGSCWGTSGDLTSLDGVQSLAEYLKAREDVLHTLVNNAGIESIATLETFSEIDWDTVLAVNLKSPFFLVQALLNLLRRGATSTHPSTVINIGSVGGLRIGPKENYSYAASKAALHHMTGSLARRLGPDHITVNAVAPGFFRTELTKDFSEESISELIGRVPRRRIGLATDMVALTTFLASPGASYITGAVIPLEGGMTL